MYFIICKYNVFSFYASDGFNVIYETGNVHLEYLL